MGDDFLKQDKLFQRIIYLFISLFLCALGISFMIKANLGMAPWDVLYTGVARFTSFSYGNVIKFFCILWVAIAYFLGIKPSIATIIDTCFFGSFVDFAIKINTFQTNDHIITSFLFFMFGLILFATSAGIYLNTNLGAGPHLALVLGLTNKIKYTFGATKTTLDILVLLIGIFIGGIFGIGTILNALLTGSIMEVSIKKIKLPGIPKEQTV